MWLIQHQIWEQEKNRGIIFSRVKTLKAPWHSLEIWLPCICCFMYLSKLLHVFVKVFTSNSHTRNFFSLVNLLEFLGIPWKSASVYFSKMLHVFVTCICQSCSIHIFFTIEEDISFLGWTRWKLLGIPWKSGRKRFVGSAPRLLIFHAAAYFEPRKNKTPLLAQKKHHHHFHQLRRSNHSCQKWYF